MAKVFLSAGHGGSDPGAVGYGLKEKDINLQILKALMNNWHFYHVSVTHCKAYTDTFLSKVRNGVPLKKNVL